MTDTGTKQGETAYGGKERQWVLLLYFFCKYFPHRKSKQLFSKCLCVKYMAGLLGLLMERAEKYK